MVAMVAMISLAREHIFAIAAASFLALLVASPLYLVPAALGVQYAGINIMEFGNDEHLYLTRGKEALEGKNLGQPFLAEGKEKPDPTQSYAEHILVAPLRLMHLENRIDIVTYFNVLNTLGVFALVLLMYSLGLRLSGNRWIALGSAVFAIGGYSIIEAKTFFYDQFNIYGRSIFPYASSVPFFIFLNTLFDALIAKRSWRQSVVAGALLGLLCYVYFYAWTFSVALLGSLGILFLYFRDFDALKRTVAVGALGLAVGAYYLYTLLSIFFGSYAAQISFFYYTVLSHAPVMSKIGTATAALLTLVLWRGSRDRALVFIAAIIAAGWIALNQQIITGRMLQYGHYYWYFIVPLGVIIGGALLSRLIPERFVRYIGVALIVLAFLDLAGQQIRAVEKAMPTKIHEQAYAPLLAILNGEPPGIVFTGAWGGEGNAALVTMYTSHDLYWVPSAEVHVFPVKRLREALLVHLYLNRESRADPISYLREMLAMRSTATNEYVNMYGEWEGLSTGLEYYTYQRAIADGEASFGGVRESLMREIATEYEKIKTPAAISKLLEERGVRFLIWDTSFYPEWDLSVFTNLSEIARRGPVVLYEFSN